MDNVNLTTRGTERKVLRVDGVVASAAKACALHDIATDIDKHVKIDRYKVSEEYTCVDVYSVNTTMITYSPSKFKEIMNP